MPAFSNLCRSHRPVVRSGVIGAEFEEVYQTVHEGRARFWNMGLFGGSNGYWDSATLKVSHIFWSQTQVSFC